MLRRHPRLRRQIGKQSALIPKSSAHETPHRFVLADNSLDPQRAKVAGSLRYKAEMLMAPKQRVELTGARGGPVSIVDDPPSMIVLARKIALLFRLAAEHQDKAGQIEDAADGGA
jgi:hypothetical protein